MMVIFCDQTRGLSGLDVGGKERSENGGKSFKKNSGALGNIPATNAQEFFKLNSVFLPQSKLASRDNWVVARVVLRDRRFRLDERQERKGGATSSTSP